MTENTPEETEGDRRRLPSRGAAPVRPLRARRARPARLPRGRGEVRGRRRHRGGAARGAEPGLRRRRAGAEDDARIDAPSTVEFPSPQGYGTGRGYLVRPASAPPPGGRDADAGLPVVLVIHENRGLNPHIEDIARRLALENFIAFAPDALFPLGGYPGDEDKAREMFGRARPGQDARGLPRRGALPEGRAGRQRQDRRGRLLLGRRHGQLPRHAAARARRRGAVLRRRRRRPTSVADDQGAAAARVRRQRRARQRRPGRRTRPR